MSSQYGREGGGGGERRLTLGFRVCCQRACAAVSAPAVGEHAPPLPQARSASGGFSSCSSPLRKPGPPPPPPALPY